MIVIPVTATRGDGDQHFFPLLFFGGATGPRPRPRSGPRSFSQALKDTGRRTFPSSRRGGRNRCSTLSRRFPRRRRGRSSIAVVVGIGRHRMRTSHDASFAGGRTLAATGSVGVVATRLTEGSTGGRRWTGTGPSLARLGRLNRRCIGIAVRLLLPSTFTADVGIDVDFGFFAAGSTPTLGGDPSRQAFPKSGQSTASGASRHNDANNSNNNKLERCDRGGEEGQWSAVQALTGRRGGVKGLESKRWRSPRK